MMKSEKLTWYVCLSGTTLDISQHPPLLSLRDELPAKNSVFGKIHVGSKHIRMLTMQRLTLEVLAKGPVAGLVVLKSVIPISAERTGKHSNVAENTL